MKIYRDKLYSIPDAAKRGGVTEDQIIEMIDNNVIIITLIFKSIFIKGETIPGLKRKWKECQERLTKKKKGVN